MTQPAYMQERWFLLLQAACTVRGAKARMAARLGYSEPVIYQVLNGTGLYGKGTASTDRLAKKVLHQLGSYVCPHLSEQNGEERVITSDACRGFAHRSPPIGSPRDLAHWQACRKCPHAALAAPAPPRAVVPRKKPADEAAPATESPAGAAAGLPTTPATQPETTA